MQRRFNPPSLPPLTTFRLILSVRRKRSSRSVSPARHQPACSYSRELIVAHPRRHPPFYPSPLPPLLASSRPRSFFLSRDCSGNGRDHLEAIIETYYYRLRNSVYLRHGSKLESISKKFISNAGIFSSFFLVLSFFLSISLSARFYLVSSCLQMHANGKRKNGEGRGLLYRANIFTNSRRAWPLLCRLWRRDYWLSIIWKWCLGIFNTSIFQNFWRWFRCWKGIIELNARFALTFGRTD